MIRFLGNADFADGPRSSTAQPYAPQFQQSSRSLAALHRCDLRWPILGAPARIIALLYRLTGGVCACTFFTSKPDVYQVHITQLDDVILLLFPTQRLLWSMTSIVGKYTILFIFIRVVVFVTLYLSTRSLLALFLAMDIFLCFAEIMRQFPILEIVIFPVFVVQTSSNLERGSKF